MKKLSWDGTNYTTILADGRTLTVGGDDFAESRLEMAQSFYHEAHPELDKEQVADAFANAEDRDKYSDMAFAELINPSEWEGNAIEVDEDGLAIHPKERGFAYSAWIR